MDIYEIIFHVAILVVATKIGWLSSKLIIQIAGLDDE
jgi:hypothetical protein